MTKMQIADYFEKLNLSEIEAKLYVTLLESGPITVRELAEAVEMKRTTAYLYIDQLVNKGLIMKVVKGARKLVAVVDPESSIEKLITDKLNNAKALELQFPDIVKSISNKLPRLNDIGDAEVKYYKGKNGVEKIYEQAMKSREFRSYFNIELIKKVLPENEKFFVDGLNKNPGIKIYELFQYTPLSKTQLEDFQTVSLNHKNYFYKFLPKHVHLSAADVLIFDNNVAIINVENQITGVVLNNTAYYNNSKELFDLTWNLLPDETKI